MFPRVRRSSEKKILNNFSCDAGDGKHSSPENETEATVDRFSNWKDLLGSESGLSLKVLVIDHDDDERSMIADVVKRCGASATTARNGSQAFERMQHAHFEMIFSRLHVPGMDGFDLVDIVRKTSPDAEVYMITPCEEIGSAVACTKRGAEGFIVKPDVADQVAVVVARGRDRKHLRRLAYTDGLTSLFNRDSLKQFLLQECHRSARHRYSFALLILDVDNFKQYNDMNGHLIGDIALIKLGKLLKQNTRASDIPARYGGDEFAVMLTEVTKYEALLRARRIRQLVSETPFQREKNMPGSKLTVSIGLALYPEHGSSFFEIMGSADQALYRAKAGGRNQVCIFKKASRGNPS